jgi:murein DD-endopeptidase MepM/ murein hydrolase activator NlpD
MTRGVDWRAGLALCLVCAALAALVGGTGSSSRAAQITATPVRTPTPTLTLTPTIAPTLLSTLIPGVWGGDVATWTPPAPDNRFAGNFLFVRPFSDDFTTYWARNYSYGSTDRGQRRPHTGLDFPNGPGTPIQAAADGTVFYAGPDIERLFGPQPDFYGVLVVIEHPFMYNDGSHIYTLYGHMSEIAVATGQPVKAGDTIGYVGSTGVAIGPHLHFEVRVGDAHDYDATRNPELWIIPYYNMGVLAAQVTDPGGAVLEGVQVEVKSPGVYFAGISYTGAEIQADPLLNENVVIPDIPAGYHMVSVARPDGTVLFRQAVYIWPNQVTRVQIAIVP